MERARPSAASFEMQLEKHRHETSAKQHGEEILVYSAKNHAAVGPAERSTSLG